MAPCYYLSVDIRKSAQRRGNHPAPRASARVEEEGSILELTVERLVPGGEGFARHGGRTVFIPLSAPGDSLRVRVSGGGGDWLRAEIVDILEASPARRTPPCPLFGLCGGCDFMHLGPEVQAQAKKAFLEEALARSGGLGAEALPEGGARVLAGQEFGARARFQFQASGGKPCLSRRASRDLVTIPDCPVATEDVRSWLASPEALPPSGRFTVFGSGGRIFIEGRDKDASCGIGGRELRFPLGSFFQSNPAALERLVLELQDDPGGEALVDLYGGVGTLSSFLAPLYRRVTVVESDLRSAGFIERNFPADSPPEIHALAVAEWLGLPSARRSYDTVLCDPPRGGLSAGLRAWLRAGRFRRLAYLSCDLVTLARDLGSLCEEAYRVSSLSLHDFYPQTAHAECLAVLEALP